MISIFFVGFFGTFFAHIASYDKAAGVVHLWELVSTLGLFSLIAMIFAGICSNDNRVAGGWWIFVIGVLFCLVGGLIITQVALISWMCLGAALSYLLLIGAVRLK